MTIIEICVENAGDIQIARSVGADRVEVVRNLHTGGLTPDNGLIEKALEAGFPSGVRVIVRENPDTFYLTDAQVDHEANEIRRLTEHFAGAPLGFVVGGLSHVDTFRRGEAREAETRINVPAAKQWRDAAGNAPLVFHRAFDQVDNTASALDALADLDYDAVLTTGGHETTAQTIGLAKLVDRSGGRISIIGSGRIRHNNAARIVEAAKLEEIHFRVPTSPDGKRDRNATRKTIDAVRSLVNHSNN